MKTFHFAPVGLCCLLFVYPSSYAQTPSINIPLAQSKTELEKKEKENKRSEAERAKYSSMQKQLADQVAVEKKARELADIENKRLKKALQEVQAAPKRETQVTESAASTPTQVAEKVQEIVPLIDSSKPNKKCLQQVDTAHSSSSYDPNCEPSLIPGNKIKGINSAPLMVLPSASTVFFMGSGQYDNEKGENGNSHKVTIAYRFEIGKGAITSLEYMSCVRDFACDLPDWPGFSESEIFRKDDSPYFYALFKNTEKEINETWKSIQYKPATGVSWFNAKQYAAWVTKKVGLSPNDPHRFRLPTEAEWEYVAQKFSDKLGMKGEREWVEDCWHKNYIGAPSDGSAWTMNCVGTARVNRGTYFDNKQPVFRSESRFQSEPGFRDKTIGFRLARTLAQ